MTTATATKTKKSNRTHSNAKMARAYAEAGIRVFPCKPDTKAPRPRNGFNDATTEMKKIISWWNKNPDDLIGGVCDDTFTVVDVDCGGVPDKQKEIILDVVSEMKDLGVITDDTPSVQTKSGGLHYYFKTTDEITRKINYLPAIDILARGGYVILPDNHVYTPISGSLVDEINSLGSLDMETVSQLHEKYDDLRKEVKYDIDVAKGKKPKGRRPSKKKKPTFDKKKTTELKDEQAFYKASDKKNDDDDIDPTEILLDEDGMVHIDAYTLDTDLIKRLFFNQQIQEKLAKHLGLRVPSASKTSDKGTLQRSILVGHTDNNPSMGVRWAKEKKHLIARDFSNHYADDLIDYNVVRLFINRKYGVNMPTQPSKTEWTVWFLRMLYDVGMMDIDHVMHDTSILDGVFGRGKKMKEAAEHIFLLDAIKRLHARYSDEFPVSKAFMSAWCKGIHPNTSYKTVLKLQESGVIKHVRNIELDHFKEAYLWKIVAFDTEEEEEMDDEVTQEEENALEEEDAEKKNSSIDDEKEPYDFMKDVKSMVQYAIDSTAFNIDDSLEPLIEEEDRMSTDENIPEKKKWKSCFEGAMDECDDDLPLDWALVDWADANDVPWEEIREHVLGQQKTHNRKTVPRC